MNCAPKAVGFFSTSSYSALRLLGVTVLTSFDQHDLEDLGTSKTVADLVEQRALKARDAGMDGIVCSPWRRRRCGGCWDRINCW